MTFDARRRTIVDRVRAHLAQMAFGSRLLDRYHVLSVDLLDGFAMPDRLAIGHEAANVDRLGVVTRNLKLFETASVNSHRLDQRRTNSDRRDTTAASVTVNSNSPVPSGSVFIAFTRKALSIAAQIAVLWFINLGASAAVAWLHAPVPGNVLGLTVLFTLLCSGIVKASWLEPAATLLVKHLAFFFIPITIGLMDMGQLFALHGVGILFTLAISAAVGMAMCGLTSQCLMNVQNGSKAQPGSGPDA